MADCTSDLYQFRVPGPPEVYYIPDFLTEEEEEYLLRKVRLLAPPFRSLSANSTMRESSMSCLSKNGNSWQTVGTLSGWFLSLGWSLTRPGRRLQVWGPSYVLYIHDALTNLDCVFISLDS